MKRKYRWTLEGNLPGGKLEPVFVKIGARPSSDGETGIMSCSMFETPNKICDLVKSGLQDQPLNEKSSSFTLTLYDGCGSALECWTMNPACVAQYMEDYVDEDYSTAEFRIYYEKIEYKSLIPDYNKFIGIGLGITCSSKVKCPKCEHEFEARNSIF